MQSHRSIFPEIKRYAGSEADVYLEVVSSSHEGEEPSGLYLSSETISLLSEMGGALDNDIVIVPGGRVADGLRKESGPRT